MAESFGAMRFVCPDPDFVALLAALHAMESKDFKVTQMASQDGPNLRWLIANAPRKGKGKGKGRRGNGMELDDDDAYHSPAEDERTGKKRK